jgi:hypothetical protein
MMKIDHEPAYNWWVPHVLKKRDRIISLVKKRIARYLKRNHKFGIEIPTSVKDALEIDKKNGNTYWADAIATKMKNVCAAFKILPDGTSPPKGYQRIHCHMVFYVNSLTPICVWAGIKKYRSVEFPRRNSTFFCLF